MSRPRAALFLNGSKAANCPELPRSPPHTALEHCTTARLGLSRRRHMMNASEVMPRNVVTLTRGTPIREAIRLMLDHRISGLPVADTTGKVEGILTEGDLLRRSEIATERRR